VTESGMVRSKTDNTAYRFAGGAAGVQLGKYSLRLET
jgi:hypothetical protein